MSLFSSAFEDFLNHASADDMFQRAKSQSPQEFSQSVCSEIERQAQHHRVSVDYYIQEFL